MHPEQHIVEKLKQGNKTAVLLLFDIYHKSLYYFAKETINDHEVAEDVVARAFINLWQSNTGFDELVAIKSFLYAAVRNGCLNYLGLLAAKTQLNKPIFQPGENNEDYFQSKMIKAELLRVILQEIQSLPPLRRKIFELAFLDGFNIFEIAEKLQLSIDTVRVQKAKALYSIRLVIPKEKI